MSQTHRFTFIYFLSEVFDVIICVSIAKMLSLVNISNIFYIRRYISKCNRKISTMYNLDYPNSCGVGTRDQSKRSDNFGNNLGSRDQPGVFG